MSAITPSATNPRAAKRAFLGMSHSPLLGLNPVSDED